MYIYSTDNIKEKVFSHVRDVILRTFPNAGVFENNAVLNLNKPTFNFVIEPLPTTGRSTIDCKVSVFSPVKDNHLDGKFIGDYINNFKNAFTEVPDIIFRITSVRIEDDNVKGFGKMSFWLSVIIKEK